MLKEILNQDTSWSSCHISYHSSVVNVLRFLRTRILSCHGDRVKTNFSPKFQSVLALKSAKLFCYFSLFFCSISSVCAEENLISTLNLCQDQFLTSFSRCDTRVASNQSIFLFSFCSACTAAENNISTPNRCQDQFPNQIRVTFPTCKSTSYRSRFQFFLLLFNCCLLVPSLNADGSISTSFLHVNGFSKIGQDL